MSISTCALREEGDPAIIKITASHSGFLSTPSARRATGEIPRYAGHHRISIHALREEGDPGFRLRIFSGTNFYPRPPRGGRPEKYRDTQAIIEFLSTPSARRATPVSGSASSQVRISIHALREEGDLGELHKQLLQLNFYPRPPRGGRHAHISIPAPFAQFLSTPSARRATAAGCFDGTDKTYFYPRPPRGGRRYTRSSPYGSVKFLSTPSARRATLLSTARVLWISISIHALREEGDGRHPVLCCFGYYFYPRPPRGGRLFLDLFIRSMIIYFYPRPPRGGRH